MKLKLSMAALAASATLLSTGAMAANMQTQTAPAAPYYAGLNSGVSFLHWSDKKEYPDANKHIKAGYNVGGFAGYKFNQNWRADVSVDYTRNSINVKDYNAELSNKPLTPTISAAHINQLDILVNGYYDLPLSAQLTPFVGLGIGYAHTKANASVTAADAQDTVSAKDTASATASGFAWQVSLGTNYTVMQNLDLGIAYRLLYNMESKKPTTNPSISADLITLKSNNAMNNSILASLTYHFNVS